MQTDWHAANWELLIRAIAVVRDRIVDYIARSQDANVQENSTPSPNFPLPPALTQLCTVFNLSPFERSILLTCVGMELDSSFAVVCGQAQGDLEQSYPSFSLMMAIWMDQAEWAALIPEAPLRRWRLIEVGTGATLMHSPLRIDERILHHLTGEPYLDTSFRGMIRALAPATHLVPSHQQLAEQIAKLWTSSTASNQLPIVQLYGPESSAKQTIATAAAEEVELSLYRLSARTLPTAPADLHTLILLWEREALLSGAALLLDCDAVDLSDTLRVNAIAQIVEAVRSPLILSTRERDRALFDGADLTQQRPLISLPVHPPTSSEQRLLWQTALNSASADLNGCVEKLAAQFTLPTPAIFAVAAEALLQQESDEHSPTHLSTTLWNLCRLQAQPQMDDLAQRIEATATWEDLVLPEVQMKVLRAIAAHVRQRSQVYERWGFEAKGSRGLGISALFAGASGTGKTMAAEVLAQELRLDLYRIDLSSVVSKYIGETEKNLRRVFDAAEAGSAILLFDEADALFGKRSDVKDSHDRYANMEVSYLLQRMEAYQGLAILTTNMKESIDTAFLRRIRFVIKFPFPDASQREEIWRRIFPKATPVENLEITKLAKLNVSGGNIRNIALNAAFLAADAQTPVKMEHLLEAAQEEYLKLERTLTDSEIKGWR